MPVTHSRGFVRVLQTLGHGRSGTHALMLALEELAQIHVSASPA